MQDPAAAANRVRALALVQPLRDLVAAVVTDLRNAWWSAPLDRGPCRFAATMVIFVRPAAS